VPISHDAQGKATVALFSVLPSVADLDSGKKFECRLAKEQKCWWAAALPPPGGARLLWMIIFAICS
jgi:hypothetical protein